MEDCAAPGLVSRLIVAFRAHRFVLFHVDKIHVCAISFQAAREGKSYVYQRNILLTTAYTVFYGKTMRQPARDGGAINLRSSQTDLARPLDYQQTA